MWQLQMPLMSTLPPPTPGSHLCTLVRAHYHPPLIHHLTIPLPYPSRLAGRRHPRGGPACRRSCPGPPLRWRTHAAAPGRTQWLRECRANAADSRGEGGSAGRRWQHRAALCCAERRCRGRCLRALSHYHHSILSCPLPAGRRAASRIRRLPGCPQQDWRLAAARSLQPRSQRTVGVPA